MSLPFQDPEPTGSERAHRARDYRHLAADIARIYPTAITRHNGEEADHPDAYPANFTKGLVHDQDGLIADPTTYRCFVEAINAPDPTIFEKAVPTGLSTGVAFHCTKKIVCGVEKDVEWRGWESPRAGHSLDLQGPDAGALGMAPAPRVGSSELAAEMAEVYALALLRDVPFTVIAAGGDDQLCGDDPCAGKAERSAATLVDLLNGMPFYSGNDVSSSTPHQVDSSGLNRFERNRRFARTQSPDGLLTPATAFRGSTKGALAGPYISQFMLVGAGSRACAGGGTPSYPGLAAPFDLTDGYIPYGSQIIDQRTLTHTNCLDFMTDWCAWLDVQNGANFKNAETFESQRRFITTPRDLATYVHFDALYQAYLNACLILLALEVPKSKGFPEPSPSKHRDAFATFGDPHILSLVTEVATRCLKAVRRQKFNYHRRARPEVMGGRFTLMRAGQSGKLKRAEKAFKRAHDELPADLRDAIVAHNVKQNAAGKQALRGLVCNGGSCAPEGLDAADFADANLLLPMAFAEGSPMHPAYGAGHATVAGGCVTMLKLFFEMFDDEDSFRERELLDGNDAPIVYVPTATGTALEPAPGFSEALTIQGELDKLAANISIGRNMAGVHYYSDYYDSLRLGERVAVGIFLEQAPSYGEVIGNAFKSFDGDYVTITGEPGSCPAVSIIGRDGSPVAPRDWWLRHVVGEEVVEDL
jgi:hypothetical protein